MTDSVDIVEVGPRDGLQNEPQLLDTSTKVEFIKRLVGAGARRIEAVSFVHPRRVPQMADAEAVMAAVPRQAGVSYIGLVLNRRGLDRALAAGVDEVNYVVITTETFSRRNQGMGVEASLGAWHDIAQAARDAGLRVSLTVSAAFGCPFEGEVAPGRVLEIVESALATPADEIAIADTIGVGVPRQVRELASRLTDTAPGVPLRMHFHNTRNTGYANALAAVESGVRTLDASAGGIGGCPFAPAATGNIATEDLLYTLHRSGMRTGVDLQATAATGIWICERLGQAPPPAMLGRAGDFPA